MTLTSFLTNIADKLRSYLGGDKIPAQSFADKIDQVYAAGQNSVMDENRIIEKTASGNPLTLDDVSEIPHVVTAMLATKNLYPKFDSYNSAAYHGVAITVDEDGTIHLNGTATATGIIGTRFQNALKKTGRYYLCDFATGQFPASDFYRTQVYDDIGGTILRINNNSESDAVESAEFSNLSPIFRIQVIAGHTYNDCTLRPTLFYKEKPTVYIPYRASVSGVSITRYGANATDNPQTYTANSEGVIEGIKSLAPYMTLVSDADVNIYADYHRSWGMQTEYDRFWEAYQGSDNNMVFRYSGRGWANTQTFRPKKNMQPANAQSMFSNWNTNTRINLKDHLDNLGVVLDFSKATNMSSCFSGNTAITELGVIDCSSATDIAGIFSYAMHLTKIQKLILPSASVNYANAFSNTNELEDITVEGEFAANFDMHWSALLSYNSIVSIVNALSRTTSGLTVILSLDAVNKAFETAEGLSDGSSSSKWTSLIASKSNWTISLI